ncbi:hypothetical protein RRG08_005927, partial [Elysia crispata]
MGVNPLHTTAALVQARVGLRVSGLHLSSATALGLHESGVSPSHPGLLSEDLSHPPAGVQQAQHPLHGAQVLRCAPAAWSLCRECCGLRRERSPGFPHPRSEEEEWRSGRRRRPRGTLAEQGGRGGGGGRMRNGKEEEADSGYRYSDGIATGDSCCSEEDEDEDEGRREEEEERGRRTDPVRRKCLAHRGSVDSHAMLSGFDSPLFRRDCAIVDL